MSMMQMLLAAGGASRFVFSATISSNTNNYNIKAAAIAAGWDQVMPLDATITRAAGIVIGSTSTATPAFDTGSGFPATSTLYFDNSAATGEVQGKGGDGVVGGSISSQFSPGAGLNGNAGGTALRAQHAITVKQSTTGTIRGGGGSGASGGAAGIHQLSTGDKTSTNIGTGGSASGGGQGTNGGASASGGTATITLGWNLGGNASTAGTASAVGTGGASAQQNSIGWPTADGYCRGAAGANGGAAGSAGANSGASSASAGSNSGTPYTQTGKTGGAAGNAVEGNSNITWDGTGTRTGPIT